MTDLTYFAVTTLATNGAAYIDPTTGAWTFTPTDPNWIGTDQFTVTITDDKGGTTDQLVSVTLANVDDDPATIGGDISYTGNEGDTVNGTMTASDPEGVADEAPPEIESLSETLLDFLPASVPGCESGRSARSICRNGVSAT